MDKKVLFRKMNEALALEQTLLEAEGAIATRTGVPDLRQATSNAIRDDENHMVILRRMIMDLGGRVEPPASIRSTAIRPSISVSVNS